MSGRLLLLLAATALLLAGCLTIPRVSVPGVDAAPAVQIPMCRTPVGQCRINAYAVPGAACWCPTRKGGAAVGEVVGP